MTPRGSLLAAIGCVAVLVAVAALVVKQHRDGSPWTVHPATVHRAAAADVSPSLAALAMRARATGGGMAAGAAGQDAGAAGVYPPDPDHANTGGEAPAHIGQPAPGAKIEQRSPGPHPALPVIASFDGLGWGFTGPQGAGRRLGNPSDNTLAVGPNHIVQIVNGGMAVFTKKGAMFDTTGKVLYGPMRSNAVFTGFGGPCETRNSGDAVVRYDQLAQRWLYVLPVFTADTTAPVALGRVSRPGQSGQPGEPGPPGLINTPAPPPPPPPLPRGTGGPRGAGGSRPSGPYSMCYAVSVGPDPLGPYYRYEFLRPLFPDYPRPAVWPDGYYVPSSTSDNFIQKHFCVADRNKMLVGLAATEQCIIIDNVNFLNNADIDGQGTPPLGAPNIVLAAGGAQLHSIFEDDAIYAWQFHVDWDNPANTGVSGPVKIPVAPYHYLCNGQLTKCVPQPDTATRLDAQGDKLMQRVVYRNTNGHESILALHSVNTAAGGGGVRWYEFRLDARREPVLYQQGTYAPDSLFRWMGSIDMDRQGNIGIGYSFGGGSNFPGQRFAARLANDPPGQLGFREAVLVQGEASQKGPTRWEDYTTTAMDPTDDCTFWYVGDYVKQGAPSYSTRIGAFRVPGCMRATITGTTYLDLNHNGVRDGGEPGLAGWLVEFSGAQSMRLKTDASGGFSREFPADPAYGGVDYIVSSPAATRGGWAAMERPPSRTPGSGVVPTGAGYRVHVRDLDYVTGVDFGRVCVVAGRGGHEAVFWTSDKGRAVLATHDSAWRVLIDSTLRLVGDTSRFSVPRKGAEAYDQLRRWLLHARSGSAGARESAALAVTGLNVAFGGLDGSATINDPVAHEWTAISALIARVNGLILVHPDSATEAYTHLLDGVNGNSLQMTPSTPAGCPQPF